jgi:hypothetical protein
MSSEAERTLGRVRSLITPSTRHAKAHARDGGRSL